MKKNYFAFISMIMLFSLTNISEAFAQNSTVYMCTGKYSVKYHKNKNCSGLANCTGEIVTTTASAAKKAGKEECQKCFANSVAPAAKNVKKQVTSEKKVTEKQSKEKEKTTKKVVAPKKETTEKKVTEKRITEKKTSTKAQKEKNDPTETKKTTTKTKKTTESKATTTPKTVKKEGTTNKK